MLTWTEFAAYISLLTSLGIAGVGLVAWRLDWWSPRYRPATRRVSD